MNISGILVVTAPDNMDATVERLQQMEGIDVHHTDAPTGRIIITQEAETIHDEVDGLKKIRTLPGIILAEMSYHHFEEDHTNTDKLPEDLDKENLDVKHVPRFLNEEPIE
jgi:nitrate reductase NapD